MPRTAITTGLLGLILIAGVAWFFQHGHEPALAQDSGPQIGGADFADPGPPPPDVGFRRPDELFGPAEPPPIGADIVDVTPIDISAAANEWLGLQQEFVDLATKRAQMMTVEELQAEIEVARDALREVTARRELEEAREILSRLLQQHPDSEAASKARRMLDAEKASQDFETPAEVGDGITDLDGSAEFDSAPESADLEKISESRAE